MCTNFQTKQTPLTLWAQICPKNRFWDRNFKNLSLDSESASLRYYVHQFSYRTDNFDFLAPNLPKIGFWCRNFENQSLDSETNTSNIPCVPIFSQNGQLLIFRPKFGEIAQLRAIFWFKYCWGCCRELGGGWNELGGGGWSWVEVEMSWVEVDGAGWRLKWAGWMWMELGGAGWSWVELGAWFSNTLKNLPFCAGYWHVVEYNLGGQTQSTLTKWTAKVGVLVKDLHIFLRYSFEVFACFLRKWRFFSILNK